MGKAEMTIPLLEDYAAAEAMNTICSNLTFNGEEYKRLLLTSVAPHDGKSYMTMQIMRNLADRGRSVVVIDADLRRSSMVKEYHIELTGSKAGLAHYLAGRSELADVIYETNYRSYIIPVGQIVYNPVALLSGKRFVNLLDSLAKGFDYVLIDTPPIGAVNDAAVIARVCDGAIFVTSYNNTRGRELRRARRQIDRTGCDILGSIINRVTFEDISSKKYYQKSYYQKYSSAYYHYEETGKTRQE